MNKALKQFELSNTNEFDLIKYLLLVQKKLGHGLLEK